MKPGFTLLVLFALLAGCSKDKQEAVQADTRPLEATEKKDEIVLEPSAQKEARIVIAKVETTSLPKRLQTTGRITVDENRTWRVGAVTDGRAVRIFAKVGDQVTSGQILARYHTHDIHESRALYRRAISEVARQKSVEAFARRARDRARRLYDLKAASLEQMEHAETELKNAQTALQAAEIEEKRTRQHLEEFLEIPAEDPHEHDTAGSLAHDEDLVPVKAPAGGTVLARNINVGTVISPSHDLFVISDLSSLWAILSVNEEHLRELRPGLPVHVSVQAYPQQFEGKIFKVGEELDATTRTVSVRVQLPNPHRRLKPEMYATAEIELGASEPALFIPQGAVQEVEGQSVVFVQQSPSTFTPRPVTLGGTVRNMVQVTRGLKSGEAVVAHGSFIMKSQLLKATLSEE